MFLMKIKYTATPIASNIAKTSNNFQDLTMSLIIPITTTTTNTNKIIICSHQGSDFNPSTAKSIYLFRNSETFSEICSVILAKKLNIMSSLFEILPFEIIIT